MLVDADIHTNLLTFTHTVTLHVDTDTSDSCVRNLTVFPARPPQHQHEAFRTSSLNTNTGETYITLLLHKHNLGGSPESFKSGGRSESTRPRAARL